MKTFSQISDLVSSYSPLLFLPEEGKELVSFSYSSEHPPVLLHRDVIQNIEALKTQLSAEYHIELAIASSYRSIERQVHIWQQKIQGIRPSLDQHGKALNLAVLAPYEQLRALSYWSAFPGLSRHHYGTEIDVYDLQALKNHPNYKLQLIQEEYQAQGIFERLGEALENLSEQSYRRVYWNSSVDQLPRSIGPEPWHLSFMHQVPSFQQEFFYGSLRHKEIIFQFLHDLEKLEEESTSSSQGPLRPLITELIRNFDSYWQEFISPYRF